MKEFWSSRIRNMVPYTPGEQPRDRTFIKLNTNENPYPPAPRALEAAKANGSWTVLDGPEAGIEPEELTAASASLPRKLPTIRETAVLYSC